MRVATFFVDVDTTISDFGILPSLSVRLAVVEKSIYSAEYQRLCDLLRQLREEAELTQVEVAERLNEPQSFVSKYESGQRRLDVIELKHVARALGVSLHQVLERLGE